MGEVIIAPYVPFDHETITVSSSAVGLTQSKFSNYLSSKLRAFITCEGAQIRFWLDGTAPTSTDGHLLEAGQNLTIDSPDALTKFKAIRTGTTDATLRVSYFKS